MFLPFTVALMGFSCLLVCGEGYEVLEGKYTGEKYVGSPNPDAHYQYSSSYISSGVGGGGPPSSGHVLPLDASEGRSSVGIFGALIKQLSSVLHRSIVGSEEGSDANKEVSNKGRSIEEPQKEPQDQEGTMPEERKADEGELYYHYYPHNQHLFNLPECATQQVCNAVYIRLNFTQPLCACPALSDPCSASYLATDDHTIELKMGKARSNAITLVKTCEPIWSVRECRKPRDWAILALQNTRTGKAHYLVICKCATSGKLDGPLNHDQPTYAQVPGIRVYGMMCNSNYRTKREAQNDVAPEFPWWRVKKAMEEEFVGQDLLREQDDLPSTPQLTSNHL